MNVQEYWDDLADAYVVKNSTTDWLLGYPTVLKALGELNGKTVIDYGCGNGRFSTYLARTYPLGHVIGLDTSKKAIARAQANSEESLGTEFHYITSENALDNFEPDVVCANFVFCTTPSMERIKSIIKKVYDRLPKGGVFVVLDPHPETHGKKFSSFRSEEPRTRKSGEQVHVQLYTNSVPIEFEDYYWTTDDYKQALTESGFNIYETKAPVAAGYEEGVLGEERQYPPYIIFRAVK